MKILSKIIEDYIYHYSEPESNLLKKLSKETQLKTSVSHMLSGNYQGQFLKLISKLIKPKYILEIGTFTGYSTLCLVEGLSENGILITIDKNLHPISQKYFKNSKNQNKICSMNGNALDIIPKLLYKFNLVFIDADKKNYEKYFDLVIQKMSSGGVIISDNVFLSGKVFLNNNMNDKYTLAMQLYNEKLQKDPRIENIILPIRDGLTISRVK